MWASQQPGPFSQAQCADARKMRVLLTAQTISTAEQMAHDTVRAFIAFNLSTTPRACGNPHRHVKVKMIQHDEYRCTYAAVRRSQSYALAL